MIAIQQRGASAMCHQEIYRREGGTVNQQEELELEIAIDRAIAFAVEVQAGESDYYNSGRITADATYTIHDLRRIKKHLLGKGEQ
jgi:hypothetical protein